MLENMYALVDIRMAVVVLCLVLNVTLTWVNRVLLAADELLIIVLASLWPVVNIFFLFYSFFLWKELSRDICAKAASLRDHSGVKLS
jgi:hypothetical protein